jgi:nucleotide-binding universal stress UspA family protein
MFEKILLAIDGSEQAGKALSAAETVAGSPVARSASCMSESLGSPAERARLILRTRLRPTRSLIKR